MYAWMLSVKVNYMNARVLVNEFKGFSYLYIKIQGKYNCITSLCWLQCVAISSCYTFS